MDIRLRALEQTDLEQLRDWRNSSWLRSFVREYRLLNMIDQRDWFDHITRSREVEMFGIEAKFMAKDAAHQIMHKVPKWKLVGVCGLTNINWVNRTAEVSLYIALARQDGGIATQVLGILRQKAFEEFNLHRLWTETYSLNVAQIARLERNGYVREGTMREHVFKMGKYHDSIIHGMVNDGRSYS